jgi:hypothetical protein
MQGRRSGSSSTNERKGADRVRFSPASFVVKRRIGGSDQQILVAAARAGASCFNYAPLSQPSKQRSSRSEIRILESDISRLIENEAARVAKQRVRQRPPGFNWGEGSHAAVASFSVAHSQSILERLRRHPQIGQAEQEFLTYTIQAVGYILGMQSSLRENSSYVRRRAKQVAAILADGVQCHGSRAPLASSFPSLLLDLRPVI